MFYKFSAHLLSIVTGNMQTRFQIGMFNFFSIINYLNVVNPEWKNQGLDLSKNINVAEVAKAYYVDRTISENDIQL